MSNAICANLTKCMQKSIFLVIKQSSNNFGFDNYIYWTRMFNKNRRNTFMWHLSIMSVCQSDTDRQTKGKWSLCVSLLNWGHTMRNLTILIRGNVCKQTSTKTGFPNRIIHKYVLQTYMRSCMNEDSDEPVQ